MTKDDWEAIDSIMKGAAIGAPIGIGLGIAFGIWLMFSVAS